MEGHIPHFRFILKYGPNGTSLFPGTRIARNEDNRDAIN